MSNSFSGESRCEKEVEKHIGKANAVLGRLEKIWKNNECMQYEDSYMYMMP